MEFGLNTLSTPEQSQKIAVNALISFRNNASCMNVPVDSLTSKYIALLKNVISCTSKIVHISNIDIDDIFSDISEYKLFDQNGDINPDDLLKLTKYLYDEVINRSGYVDQDSRSIDELKEEFAVLVEQIERDEEKESMIEANKDLLLAMYKQFKQSDTMQYMFKDSAIFDNVVRNTITSMIIEVSGFLHVNWIYAYLKSNL